MFEIIIIRPDARTSMSFQVKTMEQLHVNLRIKFQHIFFSFAFVTEYLLIEKLVYLVQMNKDTYWWYRDRCKYKVLFQYLLLNII